MYKTNENDLNNFQEKYKNYQQNNIDEDEGEEEETDREVEVVDNFKNDLFENQELKRIKEKYLLKNYESSQYDEMKPAKQDYQEEPQ